MLKSFKLLLKWFFKTIYRLGKRKKYHHNKNYWFLFRIVRSKNGCIKSVRYKNQKIRVAAGRAVANKHELLIIATGPSVSNIDDKFFEKYSGDVMGVNGAISLSKLNFSYYYIIDPGFVKNKKNLIKDIVRRHNIVLFCNIISLHAILSTIDRKYIMCSIALTDMIFDNTHYIVNGATKKLTPDEYHRYHWYNGYGFSHNINLGVFDYGTVTFAAFQAAVSLGYRRILIIGLDMNNFSSPRFYETEDDMQPTALESAYTTIMGGFYAAADYCRINNIEVINLSPDSSVDAFPKDDANKIFKDVTQKKRP